MYMKRLCVVFVCGLILLIAGGALCKEGLGISDGRKVTFDYTLTVDGKVLETSQGRGPVSYNHGKGEIIPGLSRQLEGMRVGEEKTIVVAPEEAYGMTDPKAFREIEKAKLPADIVPKVGMLLQMKTPDGNVFPVKISELKKDSVVINLNHPLAGKTLQFQVKIVNIQ
jgi:FKBP-type peptidyl-prolyl cis-trans isomerase SlyD